MSIFLFGNSAKKKYILRKIEVALCFGKGSRKKQGSSLNGLDIKRGEGVKGQAIKEKITFFGTFFSNIPFFQRPLN